MSIILKNKLNQLFNKEDYNSLVKQFDSAFSPDLLSYSLKENRRNKKHNWFKNYAFRQSVSKKPSLVLKIIKSDKARDILYHFYSSKQENEEIDKQISQEKPDEFVKLVRVTRSFLNIDKLNSFKNLDLSESAQIHLKTWDKLYEIESNPSKTIDSKLEQILSSERDLTEILFYSVIWIEERRFKQFENLQFLFQISQAYNFLVSRIINKYSKEIKIIPDKFDELLKLYLTKKTNTPKKVDELFGAILTWISFKNSILNPYCFDLTIHPKEQAGALYLKMDPESYYGWKLDGVRYAFNRLHYGSIAATVLDELIKENNVVIPKGKLERDELINNELKRKEIAINIFKRDTNINHIVVNNKAIDLYELFLPILTTSIHQMARYETEIRKIHSTSGSYHNALHKTSFKSFMEDIQRLPYFLITKSDYKNMIINSINDYPKDILDIVVDQFSYKKNDKVMAFDKFRDNYNVWLNPFIDLGDFLFCPATFLANNDWFYAIAQKAIDNLSLNTSKQERVKTSDQLEEKLGQLFKNKKWDVRVISRKEASNIKGDVDVIIRDGKNTLFIQLKRTRFRLDSQAKYYEHVHTDLKAAQQLNDAENDRKNIEDLFPLGNHITKWIVTTSFEGILSKVDGCLKVNYFELIRNLKGLEFSNLKTFIEYIENDKELKNIKESYVKKELSDSEKIQLHEANFPVKISDTNSMYIPLFYNENDVPDYYKIFHEAIENENDKINAIEMLEKCLIENPNDPQLYGAIANFYADIKNHDKSEEYFEMALAIMPNEPFLIRNYALMCYESDKRKKYNELHHLLINKYWYMDLIN